MKFMFATLLLSGSLFAYTTSPAGNERVRDPAWSNVTESREPASIDVKDAKPVKESDKKVDLPKPKN